MVLTLPSTFQASRSLPSRQSLFFSLAPSYVIVGIKQMTDTSDDEWEAVPPTLLANDVGLFVPTALMMIDDDSTPALPNLPIGELPQGATVWLCDIKDILLLGKGSVDPAIARFAHGQAIGHVMRHGETFTFVVFDGSDSISYGFSVPRSCLSKKPIPPKAVPYPSTLLGGGGFQAGSLGPKAGRANQGSQSPAVQSYFRRFCNAAIGILIQKPETSVKELFEHKDLQSFQSALDTLIPAQDRLKVHVTYAWQSKTHLSQSSTSALSFALQCIEANASSPIGFVCAAEVYTKLGKHSTAEELLKQASFLIRDVALASHLDVLLGFSHSLDSWEKNLVEKGLSLVADEDFVRSVVSRRPFRSGEVIAQERSWCWTPTFSHERVACIICQQLVLGNSNAVPIGSGGKNSLDGQFACSAKCAALCQDSFGQVELGEGRKAFFAAKYVLDERSQTASDPLLVETGRLVCRAFSQVLSRFRRRRTENGGVLLMEDLTGVMVEARLLPLCLSQFSNKDLSDISTLYAILSSALYDDERSVFSCSWFLNLFMTVHSGRVGFDFTDSTSHNEFALGSTTKKIPSSPPPALMYLPLLSSCRSRSVAIRSSAHEPGVWELVALRDIQSLEQL